MTLAEVFAREASPAPDLRAIVTARATVLGIQTTADLARRMAPRWRVQPESARKNLDRWQNRQHDMGSDALAELLAELGLTVTPA